jgi:hypothetical protein
VEIKFYFFVFAISFVFQEGLLECQDFLQWQLDMLEKCKTCDDGLLKFIIPLILQYVDEFTQCEILSRKLVFQVRLDDQVIYTQILK